MLTSISKSTKTCMKRASRGLSLASKSPLATNLHTDKKISSPQAAKSLMTFSGKCSFVFI